VTICVLIEGGERKVKEAIRGRIHNKLAMFLLPAVKCNLCSIFK